MTHPARAGALTALICVALAGCGVFSDDDEILPGERIPVRAGVDERVTAPEIAAEIAAVTPPQANDDWTQINSGPTHSIGHVAGPASPSIAWRADIGEGGEVLTATPVVANGRVYALDAGAEASVFSTSGEEQWRVDLSPEAESGSDGFGGGLAVEDGRLFVTTGFGQIFALDAASGEEIWRAQMTAPIRAAPSVSAGVVIAIARDNTAIAYAAEDGAVRWRVNGASSEAGALGGASAAISPGGVAILPFGSGELIAVRASSGQRLWSDVVSGGRRGLARSSISDISSDPVIQGVAVIAGNQSGRLIAVDGRNGRRGWTRDFGSRSPVWIDTRTLFLVTDDAQLKRLSAQDGSTLWTTPLAEYRDPDDRQDAIAYGGPVLAGGRLLVTSDDGRLLLFDPMTGAEVGSVEVPDASGLGPVVAGGTIYLVTTDGELVALR